MRTGSMCSTFILEASFVLALWRLLYAVRCVCLSKPARVCPSSSRATLLLKYFNFLPVIYAVLLLFSSFQSKTQQRQRGYAHMHAGCIFMHSSETRQTQPHVLPFCRQRCVWRRHCQWSRRSLFLDLIMHFGKITSSKYKKHLYESNRATVCCVSLLCVLVYTCQHPNILYKVFIYGWWTTTVIQVLCGEWIMIQSAKVCHILTSLLSFSFQGDSEEFSFFITQVQGSSRNWLFQTGKMHILLWRRKKLHWN